MATEPSNDVPEAPNRSGRPGHEGNGLHPRANDQPNGPDVGADPLPYEVVPAEDVTVRQIRRSLTVIVGVALVATLATISIVAIAVGAIPVALTCSAVVLAVSLRCIVRYCFAVQRHKR